MKFTVLTLFPDMIREGLQTSIIGRAQANGLLKIDAVNIRDYSSDRHSHADDYPYGGGAGMIMQADPIVKAVQAVRGERKVRLLYTTPQGKLFTQDTAKELALENELIILCGHYEGVDERALILTGAENYSIGDYVLTGGELPAMVMIDAVSRLVPGVLTNASSAGGESLETGLLEYPQYTRPEIYEGQKVPDVLLSGNHKMVELWRRRQSLLRTMKCRPDLFENAELTGEDRTFLEEQSSGENKDTGGK